MSFISFVSGSDPIDFEEKQLKCKTFNSTALSKKEFGEIVFGGGGFDGVIRRPMFYSEQGLTTDLLNEYTCRDKNCANLKFNTNV